MSMYIRVKRHKTTVFVTVDPTDTIETVKLKLKDLLQKEPAQQRLFKDQTLLQDSKRLSELKIENDDILALTFQNADQQWEDVQVTTFEMGEAAG